MTPRSAKAEQLPGLPELLETKISKTRQTRGADDDEIYQNRVLRSGTVLIRYDCWDICTAGHDGRAFENGFIVIVSPKEYFKNPNIGAELAAKGLALGKNTLVFYETRQAWIAHNPDDLGWKPARSRTAPLGGQYVARIPATTATTDGGRIVRGFDATARKGAGIRVYEYASAEAVENCRWQLEALFWLCADADRVTVANGMTAENAAKRKAGVMDLCKNRGLLDNDRLINARVVSPRGNTTCPLCLEELSSQRFFNRMKQAEGRVVHDLTGTEINLFHVVELQTSALNHRPYNVGWGHHHCNVVLRDKGIPETLKWMRGVLQRNIDGGYLPA